jgi:cytochrome c-type biogenesis protein CcmH
LLLALALALALPASMFAEEALSPEALSIANELSCPVCQGQSVRDSNSELARQMRQVIQRKLEMGESPDAIKAYFVERYGIEILREPPRAGTTLALWWGPPVGLAVGAILLVAYLRQRGRNAEELSTEVDPAALRRVESHLLSDLE